MTGSPGSAGQMGLAAAASIVALVGAGLFGALWFLAHGADLAHGLRRGPGAASRAAEGFYGLTVLLREEGAPVKILKAGTPPQGFLIETPSTDADVDDAIRRLTDRRGLLILPKWSREPLAGHPQWSGRGGMDLSTATALLQKLIPGSAVAAAPAPSQLDWRDDPKGPSTPPLPVGPAQVFVVMNGPDLEPILSDDVRGVVLGKVQGREIFVLSDPDILDNQGLATLAGASAASKIIGHLAGDEPIVFDAAKTAARPAARTPRTTAQLLFERPFGAGTVCLCLAALLAAVQAFAIFGPVAPAERRYAFGKLALVDSAASLLAVAGREPKVAPRYLELAVRRTARAVGVSPALAPDARNRALEGFAARRGLTSLAALAGRAVGLKTRRELLAWAIDLQHWSEEMVRGRP